MERLINLESRDTYSVMLPSKYTRFISNWYAKLVSALLHVSATDCGYHQGATIWYRHKQLIVCLYMANMYKLVLYNSQFIFYYFVNKPTKAQLQLIYKLSRYYMFRHYRVIFRQFVFITSPSYISISIAAVGNTI